MGKKLKLSIIKCIKKQVPREPKHIDYEFNYYECGACGSAICDSTDDITSHKYCLACGQRVDLEEFLK